MRMNRKVWADILEWDVGNWSRAIDFWEEKANYAIAQIAEEPLALDIGGRRGGLSLYWALKGCRVICSDLNDAGFPKARELHQKYRVNKRIEYQPINALDIPYRDKFDVISFKSVLGGVGNYHDGFDKAEEMVRQIYKALKPGGYVFFVENLSGSELHMFLRKMFRKHGKSWHYVSLDEVRKIMGQFQDFEYHTFGFFGVLSAGKVIKPLLEKADRTLDCFFPERSRYIVSVICRKPL